MTDVPVTTVDIGARVERVREHIATAAMAAGRSPNDVSIVAVTKTVDRATIDQAFASGLRLFGENRVQEARQKYAMPLPPDAALHMIGQLQSNKARHAVKLFDQIESVDRPSLIDALEHAAAAHGAVLPILLQVNIAGETQKAGCLPADALSLAIMIQGRPHLALRGLMTIAPLVMDPEGTRPVFRRLRELRDHIASRTPDLTLPVLSMGMTNDYPIAVEEGSTHVRIGRAIFG